MINKSLIKRISITTSILCLVFMMCSMSFAAWWGTPGYEWCLRNGLTGQKTMNQLDREVELDDLYATILKYLSLKQISAKDKRIHHEDKMLDMDPVAKGIAEIINSYNDRESLTIEQFYIVENYANMGYDTLAKYRDLSQYMTREDLKNIDVYFKLAKYKAATLIESKAQRDYALSRLGYIKNSKIIDYNMMPYTEKITRKEFLLVMNDLLSPKTMSDEKVLESFFNAGVLIGYDTGLELDKKLLYSEMYSFLYRFEIYDFETATEKNALSDLPKYINNAKSGFISKQELITYLNEVADNTAGQVDLVKDLEEEIGKYWTIREAAEYLDEIYSKDGFKYQDGDSVITVKKAK